jgi:hypothetical protein
MIFVGAQQRALAGNIEAKRRRATERELRRSKTEK